MLIATLHAWPKLAYLPLHRNAIANNRLMPGDRANGIRALAETLTFP
jgi:hypothetical protein